MTIADIAERAGVSIGAVSFALNGRKGVSEETRARILRVADELGWAPSTAARSLAEAKTETFGLVLARDPHNLGVESFYMEFFAGLEVELSKRGFSLLLQVVGSTGEALETLRKWHRTRRVDGVVLTDLTSDDPRAAFAAQVGLPAVVVGDPSVSGGL
ncbi:LacI family transcriptional regulator, partial [Schumannella luteola]